MIDKRNVETLPFRGIVNGNKEKELDLEDEKEARCEAGKEIHYIRT